MKAVFIVPFISFFRLGINICSVCERSLSVRFFCCCDIQEGLPQHMSWRTRKALQEKMNAISSHILPAFLPTMRNTDIRGICRHTHIWRTHFTQEAPNCSQKPLKTYPPPQNVTLPSNGNIPQNTHRAKPRRSRTK